LTVYDPYIKGSNATVLKSHHSEFLSKLEKEFLNPYCAINLSNTKSFTKEILLPPAIPEQQDGYNCGPFLLEFCRHICNDAEFQFSSHHMQESRKRIFRELQKERLENFKLLSSEITRTVQRKFLNVDKTTCWLNATLQLICNAMDHMPFEEYSSEFGILLQQLQKTKLIDPIPAKRILQRTIEAKPSSLDENNIMTGQQCARDFWVIIAGNENLFLDLFKHFFHKVQQTITCFNCNYAYVREDTLLYMEESCPPDNTSLKTYLEQYYNMDQTVEYRCEDGCGKKGNSSKKIQIITRESSSFLLVILSRVNLIETNTYENKINITEDVNIIDNEGNLICYQPVGVIPHTGYASGERSAGHYICNLKLPNGKWVLCDDEKNPTLINKNNVTKRGYIILFKRKS
jgi:hypothetical protein